MYASGYLGSLGLIRFVVTWLCAVGLLVGLGALCCGGLIVCCLVVTILGGLIFLFVLVWVWFWLVLFYVLLTLWLPCLLCLFSVVLLFDSAFGCTGYNSVLILIGCILSWFWLLLFTLNYIVGHVTCLLASVFTVWCKVCCVTCFGWLFWFLLYCMV